MEFDYSLLRPFELNLLVIFFIQFLPLQILRNSGGYQWVKQNVSVIVRANSTRNSGYGRVKRILSSVIEVLSQ